jgi:endonuclease YncB( thermonuclease family)
MSVLYQTKKNDILQAIQEAQRAKRGIWSLNNRVSAAEQKRILRSESQDPAGVVPAVAY